MSDQIDRPQVGWIGLGDQGAPLPCMCVQGAAAALLVACAAGCTFVEIRAHQAATAAARTSYGVVVDQLASRRREALHRISAASESMPTVWRHAN